MIQAAGGAFDVAVVLHKSDFYAMGFTRSHRQWSPVLITSLRIYKGRQRVNSSFSRTRGVVDGGTEKTERSVAGGVFKRRYKVENAADTVEKDRAR